MECLGCRIANGVEPDINLIYQNEFVTCVLDIAPFNEGHVLILPKQHYLELEEIDSDTAYAIMDASKKLSVALKEVFHPDGITICQNGGIFNDLLHYHMHLIPRYKGDGFSWSEPLQPHGAERHLQETRDRILQVLSKESRV